MLRISLCLVFLRNSNSNPRTLGVIHTWIHRLLRWPCWITWLLAVFSVYAGSRVETPRTKADSLFFCFVLVFFNCELLTEWWRHFLGHERMEKKCPPTAAVTTRHALTRSRVDESRPFVADRVRRPSSHAVVQLDLALTTLHHPHPKFFQKSVAAKCLFHFYVNITSQCCILNKRDLCDKLFFGGVKGCSNDTKAENITLPSLFSFGDEEFKQAAICEFVTVCDK